MRRVLTITLVAAVSLTACAPNKRGASPSAERDALASYMGAIEPIRLAVNRLLDGADPILNSYRARRISPQRAGELMDALERRFADYTVAVNAIAPEDAALAAIHEPYAHTYFLEDAYLSALAASLPSGRFDDLPNTQSAQRATIIEWRTQLMILAQQTGVTLPEDLQLAGRGEIAPSPEGS
jgi:hypothetical protein